MKSNFYLFLFASMLFLFLTTFNANAAEGTNWKELYYNIVNEDKSVLNEYTIFDIDDDGVPELLHAFYDSNSKAWFLIFYTLENNDVVEIEKIEVESFWYTSLAKPAYPNKGYLILSDRGEHADYIGSGINFYKITKEGLMIKSEKIATIEEKWKEGKKGIYYHKNAYHPNELEHTYIFDNTSITKTDFFNKLSIGTQLNFIYSSAPISFEYEWEILFNTPSLYTYHSGSVNDTICSSNPSFYFDTIYYIYEILENENDFAIEAIYPSGIRELSVHSDSGVVFIMVNGSFINCGVIIENGIEMLPARIIFEALGKNVVWDSADSTIKVNGKNTDLILTTDLSIAKINGEEITLNAPPTIINGQLYVPLSLFYNKLGISVDRVPNLLSTLKSTTIIALENDYSKANVISEIEIRKQLIIELKKSTDKIRDYKEPFEAPSFIVNLGRYYVYSSAYIYGGALMVNKYTGEVYTVQLSHFFISGFDIKPGIYLL